MNLPDVGDSDAEKLAETYRLEIDKAMKMESQKRILQNNDPDEISRLQNLSLINLHNDSDKDLIPALMARLGPVRAALDGHIKSRWCMYILWSCSWDITRNSGRPNC